MMKRKGNRFGGSRPKTRIVLGYMLGMCLLLLQLFPAHLHAAGREDGISGGEAEEYTRALARKNQEFDPADAAIVSYRNGNGGEASGNPDAASKKDYTLMVYMIGSNLESKLGSASADIAEMEDAGLDFDAVNLILYTGGSTRWQAGIPCDRNCVVDMSLDEADRVVAGTTKNADMGAHETLSAFVNFCTQEYPAEHYGLIFWDHGGGPLWGYGADELFSGDGLLLLEMKLGMSHTAFTGGRKLDFVGFDACLMGSLENMTVWSEFADYYVGSEELEPGDGWDYHFLSTLNKTKDPKRITSAIVDSYSAYYKKQKSDSYDPDITLSVADLSKVSDVQAALGNAAVVMERSAEREGVSALNIARSSAKSFGITGKAEEGTQFYYDLVDLGSLAKELTKISKKEAGDLTAAVKSLIIKKYTNVDGAEGVTLYYPSANRSQYYEMQDIYDGLKLNAEYSSYLKSLARLWQSGEKRDWTLENPVLADRDYVLALTPEQQAECARVTYTILQRKENGEFVTVMDRLETAPDADGIIHLDRDPKLVVLCSQGEEALWPVTLVESSSKRRIYQTVHTRLFSSGITYFRRLTSDAVDAYVILQETVSNGKLSVKTVNTVSEDADSAGKETVELSHYDSVFYYYQQKIPTWNERGEFLPVSQWRDGSVNGSRMQVIEDAFDFALRPASDLIEELYYVVTMEDTAGGLYVTEPVKISPRRGDEILTQETEKGILTYQVFWDHAILISYSGSDDRVEIPARVFDTPVTEIAPYAFSRLLLLDNTGYVPVKSVVLPGSVKTIGSCAFYNCLELESVTLPNSVETIGSLAFGNCQSLKEIELPKRLRTIGAYAFSECSALKKIKLPSSIRYVGDGLFACCNALEEIGLSGSTAYKVLDGGLYTKDGKKLIAVPAAMTGTFTVAKGTKTIAPDCFSYSRLTEVLLPEGLETIENYGFYGAKRLGAPMLPESLQTIGKYAFSAGWSALNLSEEKEAQEIYLGSSLSYLGREAFAGFGAKSFIVSGENPLFSAAEGALLNKSGDALVEFSTNRVKTLVIPEGVCDFDVTVLEQIGQNNRLDNNHPYQIYLPDSLIRISGRTMFFDDVVFHCNPGSYAESYAREQGIVLSYETDPILTECTVPTERGELTYQVTSQRAFLVNYAGEDEELTIPSTIMGKPVKVIGNGQESLMGNLAYKSLRKMILPEGVEVIAAHAFEYFGEFEVNLPESLRVLGDQALLYCNTPIRQLPEHLEEIGEDALGNGCDFSEGVIIPESLSSIAPGAFRGIAVPEFRLAGPSEDFAVKDGMLYSGDGSILLAARMPGPDGKLIVPQGTVYIGAYAFSGLPVQEVVLGSDVGVIAQYAFAYCSMLKKVEFNEGLWSIGSYSFVFSGLESVSLPESCQRIGTAAFFGAGALKTVEGSPELLEPYAFAYCSSLGDVKLGEGTEEIGEYAFCNTAVLEVRLPDSLYVLGEGAFASEDEHLRSVVMHSFYIGKNLSRIGENAFGNLSISDFEVHDGNMYFAVTERMLTDRAGKKLIACPGGISGTVTIPEGIYEIANYAFVYCDTVTDLYIPDSVGVIGGRAFYDHSASPEGWKQERVKLHCHSGSAAHAFAVERGWPFALTDHDEEGM